jgi:hypothetical protein
MVLMLCRARQATLVTVTEKLLDLTGFAKGDELAESKRGEEAGAVVAPTLQERFRSRSSK